MGSWGLTGGVVVFEAKPKSVAVAAGFYRALVGLFACRMLAVVSCGTVGSPTASCACTYYCLVLFAGAGVGQQLCPAGSFAYDFPSRGGRRTLEKVDLSSRVPLLREVL